MSAFNNIPRSPAETEASKIIQAIFDSEDSPDRSYSLTPPSTPTLTPLYSGTVLDISNPIISSPHTTPTTFSCAPPAESPNGHTEYPELFPSARHGTSGICSSEILEPGRQHKAEHLSQQKELTPNAYFTCGDQGGNCNSPEAIQDWDAVESYLKMQDSNSGNASATVRDPNLEPMFMSMKDQSNRHMFASERSLYKGTFQQYTNTSEQPPMENQRQDCPQFYVKNRASQLETGEHNAYVASEDDRQPAAFFPNVYFDSVCGEKPNETPTRNNENAQGVARALSHGEEQVNVVTVCYNGSEAPKSVVHRQNVVPQSSEKEKSEKVQGLKVNKDGGVFKKLYRCPSCLRGFRKKSNCKRHIEIIHLNRRKFKCNVCEKSFSTKQNLLCHTTCR